MDNNKPAVRQHQIGRGRVEAKGICNEGRCEPCLLETNGQTDRAVMRLKVRELRRNLGSMGSHSVRPANRRAPNRDGPNRSCIETHSTSCPASPFSFSFVNIKKLIMKYVNVT